MSISRKYLKLFSKFPRIKWLYGFSKKYAEYCKGNNWHVFEINGEKRFLDELLGTAELKVVFDVGCNKGDWAAYLSQKLPDASLHCFEPDPTNAAKLHQRFAGNAAITINQMGAGNVPSSLTFYQYANSEQNSFHQWEGLEILGEIKVPVTTLDDYCTQHQVAAIDYLKIDTEGHDFFVLAGANKLLQEGRVKFVQFEYGPNYISSGVFLKNIFDQVTKLQSYKVFKLHSKGAIAISNYQLALDDFKLSNYALVRQDQVNKVRTVLQYLP